MNLVESVFETAEKFVEKPLYVNINNNKIEKIAKSIKLEKPKKFPISTDSKNQFTSCLLELVGNSINYCYWYGSPYIRPSEASSSKMYDIVEYSFRHYKDLVGGFSFSKCLDNLIKLLSLERFPLLESRIKHLNELRLNGEKFISTVLEYKHNKFDYLLNSMIQIFPGYASDIFLKRAILFFAQLNRLYGWFEDEMPNTPVPADYQLPKMLRDCGILEYSKELDNIIKKEQLIPEGSRMECEIRSSTIISCRRLCQKTGWSMPQIDGWFWLRRKEVTTPFHLTVTSNY